MLGSGKARGAPISGLEKKGVVRTKLVQLEKMGKIRGCKVRFELITWQIDDSVREGGRARSYDKWFRNGREGWAGTQKRRERIRSYETRYE